MTATYSFTSQPNKPILEARAIRCVRGERELFSNLNLQVLAGECLHIRGENGVGKTSLLRILAGLSAPDAGQIFWDGQSIKEEVLDYHQKLLFLGHRDALKEDLSALENLRMYASIDGLEFTDELALHTLARFGLRGRENLPVNYLSAGQKKRVLMARMVIRRAQMWILDEPFNALDTHAVHDLQSVIADHLACNGSVVLTSHQAPSIANVKVLDL